MAVQVVNPSTKFEDPYGYPFLSYEFWHLPQDTIDNANAATAHAPYHVTYAQGANCYRIFEIPDPDLPIHYTTFMALRLRQMELSAKTMYCHVLKIKQLSAHAQNHVSIERCRKSFTTIVLGDHDFQLIDSNFGNMTAFRAILAIFSLRMRRNGYLWTSG